MTDDTSELDASIQETLNELEGEGVKIENDPRPKPAEKKVEEPAKPEPEKKEEPPKPEVKPEVKVEVKPEDKKPDDGKKQPSMMPRYEHKIAEKRWQEEKEELTKDFNTKLEELQNQIKSGAGKSDIKATTVDIEKIAADAGADPVLVKQIIEAAKNSFQLPAEVQELLKQLPDFKAAQARQRETDAENQFIADFDKEVRPLIEEEYGPVSDEQLRLIRDKVKQAVVSDERLLHAPLGMIYQGVKDFRGIIKEPKKTAEPSRGRQGNTDTIDFENMTDEKFATLTDEQQDAYAAYQAGKKR